MERKGNTWIDKLEKIYNVASYVVLGLFVAFVLLLVGVRIFGVQPYVVVSGSMEPEIRTGSLVYAKKVTPEEACNFKVGDDVTFIANDYGTLVTHRIYEVVGPAYVKNQRGEYVLDENGNPKVAIDDKGYPIIMYTTYGINNENELTPTGYTLDGELGKGNLASSNIVGTPEFSIPLLGFVANFVQNPPGKYLTLALCAIMLFTMFFSGSLEKSEENEEGSNENKNESESRVENKDETESVDKVESKDETEGQPEESKTVD